MVRAPALPFTAAAVALMWMSPVAAAEPQSETAVYAIGKCFDLALPHRNDRRGSTTTATEPAYCKT